jgi:hypothetical protein
MLFVTPWNKHPRQIVEGDMFLMALNRNGRGQSFRFFLYAAAVSFLITEEYLSNQTGSKGEDITYCQL